MSHDNSYKLLFSHPEMVADLLKAFVKAEWVNDCDFSTLERVSSSYVSDDLRDREDDMIGSKFGTVSQQLQAKICQASPEEIEKWTKQIFQAETPEALLNS